MKALQKITPFLWFDGRLEEAMAQRVMAALMQMEKIDIQGLQRAAQ